MFKKCYPLVLLSHHYTTNLECQGTDCIAETLLGYNDTETTTEAAGQDPSLGLYENSTFLASNSNATKNLNLLYMPTFV